MGFSLTKPFNQLFYTKEVTLLMVGLDAAGKTTILYKLNPEQVVTSIPTIGFWLETLEYETLRFKVWDVGGNNMRIFWRPYLQNTQGLIFVVDSMDRDRIDEVKEEFERILSEEELQKVPLLVFANKQDLPGVMRVAEITDKLGLHSLENRDWYIQSSCATTGEGLHEGFDWMLKVLETD
eukprot:TRINITY_DN5408_c0_g1_i1.p1 TRINITY_DN5408_c0_g1~~TRINITY_DN5408_c0_g1_i1.p1  ORF type:complete len:180 (-),score=35.53 TRINITY_DN5408_c0_g1_i1:766-1305(-)